MKYDSILCAFFVLIELFVMLCEYLSKVGGMQVEQLVCLDILSYRVRESSILRQDRLDNDTPK